ncbi:MAG TPA: hypothetical protein VJV78_18655 [Polyangiales bacterium]|nr:hypothetical protein [Polyangiales bacterium]
MPTFQRFWLRSYPFLVSAWMCIATRVTANDANVHEQVAKADTNIKAAEPQPSAAPPPQQPRPFRARVKFETDNGIQLTSAAIPPGDSMLKVEAPADARAVTAYFSYGAIYRLARDTQTGAWSTLFEVPRELPDGTHGLSVRIVDSSGKVHWKDADYTVDGSSPSLAVDVDEYAWPGDKLHVAVKSEEPVRRMYMTLPGVRKQRVELTLNKKSGLYEGKIAVPLELPQDQLKLRIIARDRARNETQVDVLVPVNLDGC